MGFVTAAEFWGVAIPGLAMNASEIPSVDGLVALQNPGVGEARALPKGYSLADVADLHFQAIRTHLNSGRIRDGFTVVGMSMGGMIALELAAKYHAMLPAGTQYRILVSSPNDSDCPAIPSALLDSWVRVKPDDRVGLREILEPFFSKTFLAGRPDLVEAYIEYRAAGRNGQSPRDFFGQVAAIQTYSAEKMVGHVPEEAVVFISGGDDRILDAPHADGFLRLFPKAKHIRFKDLGHMVNLERPELFERTYSDVPNDSTK